MAYYGIPIYDEDGDVFGSRIGNKTYTIDTLDEWQRGFIAGINEVRELLECRAANWRSVENDKNATSLDKLRAEFATEAIENVLYIVTTKAVEGIVFFNEDNSEAQLNKERMT